MHAWVHGQAVASKEAVVVQAPVPVVALVGYTNAGKSTLLNRLTDAAVVAEDKLFATLDPTTRRVALPSNKQARFLSFASWNVLCSHLVSWKQVLQHLHHLGHSYMHAMSVVYRARASEIVCTSCRRACCAARLM